MFSQYLRRHAKKNQKLKGFLLALRNPLVTVFGYIYGAYLTLRFVDSYDRFPAIIFRRGLIRLKISKGKGGHLRIGNRLIVHPLGVSRFPSRVHVDMGATISIEKEFIIGDDVRISAMRNAKLSIGGKDKESGSGVSARAAIIVHKKIQIGKDVVIAWDTFITDSDWHPVDGLPTQEDTVIGDHVWVAVGAKILKGSIIGCNSIVAAGSVVSGGVFSDFSLIGGVPAKTIKTSIPHWHRDLELEG